VRPDSDATLKTMPSKHSDVDLKVMIEGDGTRWTSPRRGNYDGEWDEKPEAIVGR
jgi:hypothetical protein